MTPESLDITIKEIRKNISAKISEIRELIDRRADLYALKIKLEVERVERKDVSPKRTLRIKYKNLGE